MFLTAAAWEMSDALLSTWAAVLKMLGSLGHVGLEALQVKHRLWEPGPQVFAPSFHRLLLTYTCSSFRASIPAC